ncbi:MAG: EscU/YscU/HrcU family type III secretion system export apparatus switch protein [Negativicutes bacterium]|nr:EscU/YscU/HrcU family type III secretion system export apparatus switch protein [Negativicutes bacterium]
MEDENKPTEPAQAVALKYRPRVESAPVLVAKGRGKIAERIVEIAREHKVPVYKNKTMTSMLMAIDLEREIPPELYRAVAEVLAYVYRLDREKGRSR